RTCSTATWTCTARPLRCCSWIGCGGWSASTGSTRSLRRSATTWLRYAEFLLAEEADLRSAVSKPSRDTDVAARSKKCSYEHYRILMLCRGGHAPSLEAKRRRHGVTREH